MKMNVQTLSDKLTKLRFEIDPDPPYELYPEEYFNRKVSTIAPDGTETARSPRYCATGRAVADLEEVLLTKGYKPLETVMRNAINPDGIGAFKDTEPVPYFVWTMTSTTVGERAKPLALTNVALLLDYFNHGYPGEKAWIDAEAQIKGDIANVV